MTIQDVIQNGHAQESFFYSEAETAEWRHPEWPRGSYITVYKYRNQQELESEARDLIESEQVIDPEEVRKLQRAGKDPMAIIRQRQKRSGALALIQANLISWRGSAFILPASFRFRDNTKHPDAGTGREMRCTPENIALLPPKRIKQIEIFLDDLYRDPAEADVVLARFQDEGGDPPGQPVHGEAEEGNPLAEVAV